MNEPAERINEYNRSEVRIRPEEQSSLNLSIYKRRQGGSKRKCKVT